MVKDGIRINVYDMLEQRRIKNREKKKRRKARKAEAKEATAAQAESKGDSEKDDTDSETNLHDILGSWAQADTEKSEKSESNKDIPWKVRVSLDDRDSQRIDSFMSSLFPDFSHFSEVRSDGTDGTGAPRPSSLTSHTGHFVNDQSIVEPSPSSLDSDSPWPFAAEESDEDDEDMLSVKPEVRRFDISQQAPLSAAKLKTTKRSKIEKFPGRISGDMSILRNEPRCLGERWRKYIILIYVEA